MRRNFVHSLDECKADEAMKDGLFSLAAAYRRLALGVDLCIFVCYK